MYIEYIHFAEQRPPLHRAAAAVEPLLRPKTTCAGWSRIFVVPRMREVLIWRDDHAVRVWRKFPFCTEHMTVNWHLWRLAAATYNTHSYKKRTHAKSSTKYKGNVTSSTSQSPRPGPISGIVAFAGLRRIILRAHYGQGCLCRCHLSLGTVPKAHNWRIQEIPPGSHISIPVADRDVALYMCCQDTP